MIRSQTGWPAFRAIPCPILTHLESKYPGVTFRGPVAAHTVIEDCVRIERGAVIDLQQRLELRGCTDIYSRAHVSGPCTIINSLVDGRVTGGILRSATILEGAIVGGGTIVNSTVANGGTVNDGDVTDSYIGESATINGGSVRHSRLEAATSNNGQVWEDVRMVAPVAAPVQARPAAIPLPAPMHVPRFLSVAAAHQPPPVIPSLPVTYDATIPEDYLCPISHEIMRDPVSTVLGHSYDRSAITEWFKRSSKCPLTGELLRDKRLIPNFTLQSIIGAWHKAHIIDESLTK